jgi:beta-glucosidase/6-phospho-beta-glucosidase/beta-galactosidase
MAAALLPGAQNKPPPFLFGVASSAFQIEGAGPAVDGKGPSIWDTFSHTPGKVNNNDTGDVACNFYNRYESDIALMKSLGASAFRFSLAWSRILPKGRGPPNPAGIAFYHRVLDALAAAGIEPHVTLYHWDLPQALEDEYGGWRSPRSVDDFAAYADLAFREFGGRVKFWSTFNEPYTFAFCGHAYGIHAPGRCSDRAKCERGGDSDTEPWLVSHHVLLAHAAAVARFRTLVPAGAISLNLNAEWAEPATDSSADAEAAARYLDFQVGLYAEPVFLTGDYPASVRARVPSLPKFTQAQSDALKGSADYFALNHYTSRWVRDTPRGDPAGAPADAQALTELYGKVRKRTGGSFGKRRGGERGWSGSG